MCWWWRLCSLLAVVLLAPVLRADGDDYARERASLLHEIARDAAATGIETGRARFDARVMAALGRVPRERFVRAGDEGHAYENRPLPIGYGQTISQPYIVALMSDLMQAKPGDKVLEIGTGSGYQAAVAAELAGHVYSIEIVAPLAQAATQRLRELGYDNITTRSGDGYYGWPEHAPFDAILVTAAAATIPPPLIAQLKRGGRMVIPVGAPFLTQRLVLVEKRADGKVRTRTVLPVQFVPLTGKRD